MDPATRVQVTIHCQSVTMWVDQLSHTLYVIHSLISFAPAVSYMRLMFLQDAYFAHALQTTCTQAIDADPHDVR